MVAVYVFDDMLNLPPVSAGDQDTVPEYWPLSETVVTAVAPFAGAVTPLIAGIVTFMAEVAGNAAVTTPEFAELVAEVDPATVKKFAVTPVKVYPASAVSVMVAVYICDPPNLPPVSAGDQDTVPEYWPLSETVVTAVAPATGGVTPLIAGIVTFMAEVAGNAAVTTPEFAELVAEVDPATVKKFAVTPVKVYPASAVSVMVAVYICDPPNLPPVSAGDQDTVPEYWPLSETVVTAVAPATGGVTPLIAGIVTFMAEVAGNAAVTTPEFAELVAEVDPATVKKFAVTPVKVYPASAVSVMVAVYICDPPNLPPVSAGDQDTVPEYWPLSETVVTAVAPVTGAVTPEIAAVVIVVAAVAGKVTVKVSVLPLPVPVTVPAEGVPVLTVGVIAVENVSAGGRGEHDCRRVHC